MNITSLNFNEVFRKMSAGKIAFRRKLSAVNINSQKKFYDNGPSVVLKSLGTVSAELPVILERERRMPNKIRPGCA